MRGNRFPSQAVIGLFGLVLLFFSAALPASSGAVETGEFSGSWIANGTREVFRFGEDRKVYSFRVSGHVNLQTSLGSTKDYWSTCVGLADTATGATARCVWKDLEGTEVYISLQSERMQPDSLVTGTIIGGSNHLREIQGELTFKWSSVVFQKEGSTETVSGHALDLRGSYQVP